MRPEIFWIDAALPGRIAIMPRPRAGDWLAEEVAGWRAEGVDLVVSLLEPREVAELGLGDEAGLCGAHGIAFTTFPIADRGVPASVRRTGEIVRSLAAMIEAGQRVAVHCRAGIGRSSLIAACVLVRLGHDPDAAFGMIARARHMAVPDTEEQRAWVTLFAAAVIDSRAYPTGKRQTASMLWPSGSRTKAP
jgi:polymorphic toxin system DSP-PTPase phosphatase-like protein